MTRSDNIERIVYDQWGTGFTTRFQRSGVANTKQYTAQNMQVYENGTIGPRPWLRIWPSANYTVNDALLNSSWCQWRPSTTDSKGQLWVGYLRNPGDSLNNVWYYNFPTSAWVAHTGIDSYVTSKSDGAIQWGTINDWDSTGVRIGSSVNVVMPPDSWIFGGEGGVDSTDTAFDITWTDATNSIVNFCLYRDRVWGWHSPDASTDPPNRLYYTDAGSYVLSSAGGYFDIGAASEGYYIVGAWAMRESLLIAMSDGGWWVFTGTPEQGSLRFIGNYVVPAHGACVAVLDNAAWFISPYGGQVCIASPSGVDTTSAGDIYPWIGDIRWSIYHDCRGMASQQQQSVHLSTYRNEQDQWFDGIEFVNGTWTYCGYGKDRFSDTSSNLGYFRDSAVVGNGNAYAFLMDDPDTPSPGSGNAAEAQVYTRDIVLNRPSRKSDYWSDSLEYAAGDEATGLARGGLRLAPFGPPGEEVRVRQVTVDFQYWYDTGNTVYETPDMRCVLLDGSAEGVELIDTFVGSDLATFESVSLPEDYTLPLESRWIFRFPIEDQDFRKSVQVQIDDILSLAVERVIVDYEVRPDNHWGGQTGGT